MDFEITGGVFRRRRTPVMTSRLRKGTTVLPQRGGRDTLNGQVSCVAPCSPEQWMPFKYPPGRRRCPSLFGLTEQADGIRGPPLPVCQVPHSSAHLQPLRPWTAVLRCPLRAGGPARLGSGCGPALPKQSARPSQACPTNGSLSRPKKESDASQFPARRFGCSTDIGPSSERDDRASRSQRIDSPPIALSFLRVSLRAVRAVEFLGRASG
jgi:hypothetical protein